MNRTAADIARAYARFATQATSELLRLGAEAADASVTCLYWRVREQIIAVPTELAASPEQMQLRQQIRRDFWPWVQCLAPAADDRVLLLPSSVRPPSGANDDSVILLTLTDHQGELGGIIAMCVSASGCADVLGPWRAEAIGFAELVRENLLAELDRDTGLLTPASFDAEMQRWKDSADERNACACLLNLHLDYLDDIEQALGADVRRKALQEVLGLVETRLRGRDLVARLGPACIGVMLKQCDLTDAKRVCAALEERLRDYRFRSGIRRFAARLRIAMRVLDPRTSNDAGFETAFESAASASPTHVDELASLMSTNVLPLHTANVLSFPQRGTSADRRSRRSEHGHAVLDTAASAAVPSSCVPGSGRYVSASRAVRGPARRRGSGFVIAGRPGDGANPCRSCPAASAARSVRRRARTDLSAAFGTTDTDAAAASGSVGR